MVPEVPSAGITSLPLTHPFSFGVWLCFRRGLRSRRLSSQIFAYRLPPGIPGKMRSAFTRFIPKDEIFSVFIGGDDNSSYARHCAPQFVRSVSHRERKQPSSAWSAVIISLRFARSIADNNVWTG